MREGPHRITALKKYPHILSICTIVSNHEEYALMKQSFIDKGFSGCEFIYADNSDRNNFDAYSAIRRFLQEAQGTYIMIVHQDVRCVDSFNTLIEKLNHLELSDPLWAICGNAGCNGYKNCFYNLDDNGRMRKSSGLPKRVTSLDENLLIIKNSCHLTLSADIDSFHFYGTDLCIIADFLGYRAYVIEFMVKHLSPGNLAQMEAFRPTFIQLYGRKLRERFMQTTCTKFYLGNSVSKNKRMNSGFNFFWIKALNRISGRN
jgi:hypothetical protein